jgi:hypothetical protein
MPTLNEVLSKASPEVRYLNRNLVSVPSDCGSPRPVPKRAPLRRIPKEVQDEVRGAGKCLVRVTSFRCRLLDTDNLTPKWHIDALRYAGCLRGDSPEQAVIQTGQVKVRHKRDERTEIEIELFVDFD